MSSSFRGADSALSGVWEGTRSTARSGSSPASVEFRPNSGTLLLSVDGAGQYEGTYVVREGNKHWFIDLTFPELGTSLGIVNVRGNELQLAAAAPNKDRPSSFDAVGNVQSYSLQKVESGIVEDDFVPTETRDASKSMWGGPRASEYQGWKQRPFDVRIESHIVDVDGTVYYLVTSDLVDTSDNTTVVERRFKNFADLDAKCRKFFAGKEQSLSLPLLPPKHNRLFTKHRDEGFILKRRKALETYLKQLVQVADIGSFGEFGRWIREADYFTTESVVQRVKDAPPPTSNNPLSKMKQALFKGSSSSSPSSKQQGEEHL